MNSLPLLSIITPSFNRVNFVKTAIENVLAQNYQPFEHIIVDGGSTDGTLELLSQYPHLRVISEPDKGVYDALNKGISTARGAVIGQLNTDDYYQPNIFGQVLDCFLQNPNADAVCGGASVFKTESDGTERTVAVYGPMDLENFPYRVTIGAAVFNAWFFRTRVFNAIGDYSLEYPLIADRDFLIRLYSKKANVLPVHSTFYHYRQHSGSLTINTHSDSQTHIRIEILRLAEKCLQSESTDSAIKQYCVNWHDITAIELMIDFVRKRDLASSLKIMWSATKCNPKWPFLVAAQSPIRIRNYLKKKYGSNR